MRKFLFALIIVLTTHFSNAQNYDLYSNIQYNTQSGVDPNLLSLDVYKPKLYSGNRPVMIYIHGGYWFVGDKKNVGSKAELFTDSGYVFVSINYRLSPNPADTLSTTAVRFPIHPQDCANAVKWVFDNITSYSGDTSNVCLMGHSAGAHLVLLLSVNHTFLRDAGVNPESIKCTCSLDCGVFDLIEELQQAGNKIVRREPLINAFGSDTSFYEDASPQYNTGPGKNMPWMQLVYQNTADRVYSNIRFRDSLISNGYQNAGLFNANPYDHETINRALGNPSDSIGLTTSIMQFLGNCLSYNPTTNISDLEIEKVSIYPNPSDNLIFVDCQDGYQIYSATGRLLKQSNQSATQINISDLPTGLYILKTANKAGRFLKTE